MEQLICHLIGDYILQNDFMALNKKKNSFKGYIALITHSIMYTTPFTMFFNNPALLLLIALAHAIIDKFDVRILIAARNGTRYKDNFGFHKDRPAFIAFWLYVIFDNTLHLTTNYILIKAFL